MFFSLLFTGLSNDSGSYALFARLLASLLVCPSWAGVVGGPRIGWGIPATYVVNPAMASAHGGVAGRKGRECCGPRLQSTCFTS